MNKNNPPVDLIIDNLSTKYSTLNDTCSDDNIDIESISDISSIACESDILSLNNSFESESDILYKKLLLAKDATIKDLTDKINVLNQKLIDQSVLYNEKIEYVREECKKQLCIQYKQYIKKRNNH